MSRGGDLPWFKQRIYDTPGDNPTSSAKWRYIPGYFIIEEIDRQKAAIQSYNNLKATFDTLKAQYNAKVKEKTEFDAIASILNPNTIELPVRPLMPSLPANYMGPRIHTKDTPYKYNDVLLADKGGGGQLTTGLLAAVYEGKSYGVFGQGGGTHTTSDLSKGYAFEKAKETKNNLMFTVQYNTTNNAPATSKMVFVVGVYQWGVYDF